LNKFRIFKKFKGVYFREATKKDALIILKWRNLFRVRSEMKNSNLINKKDHIDWFNSLNKKKEIILIFGYHQKDAGVISIKFINEKKKQADIGFYVGLTSYLGSINNILALILAYDMCFSKFKIKTIKTLINKKNIKALYLNKSLGFIKKKNIDQYFDEFLLKKCKFEESYLKKMFLLNSI